MISQLLAITIHGYTLIQILGVICILVISFFVVIYFSTIWSVLRDKNIGARIVATPSDNKLRYSGLFDKSNSYITINTNIESKDKSRQSIYAGSQVQCLSTKYSYDRMAHIPIDFKTSDNKTYELSEIVSESSEVTDKIVTTFEGKYRCDALLREEIFETHENVRIRYMMPMQGIWALGLDFTDELSNLYLEMNYDFLGGCRPHDDQQSESETETEAGAFQDIDNISTLFAHIHSEYPALVDKDSGSRALVFLLYYKLLDPSFNAIGLPAIQNFVILMTMHIELLRMMYHAQKFSLINLDNIVTIEDAIRRFVCRCVTNSKCRSDIHDVLDKYLPILHNLNNIVSESYRVLTNSAQIDRFADQDYVISAFATEMYSKIMICLADPDSLLYVQNIQKQCASMMVLVPLRYNANSYLHQDVDYLSFYLHNIEKYYSTNTDEDRDMMGAVMSCADDSRNTGSADGVDIVTIEQCIATIQKAYPINARALNRENGITHRMICL